MPVNLKRTLLEFSLLQSAIRLIEETGDIDNILQECVEEFSIILSLRYLASRLLKIPKSSDWYSRILPTYDNNRFASCLRVSRYDFARILQLIGDHDNFKERGKRRQLPVELQLAVALFRFGHDGSGTSYWNVGQKFGISDCGMVKTSTERVIKVLISLAKQLIFWPDHEERQHIREFMSDKLPNCIGYMDGSHISLIQAPIDDHDSYFSRKQKYGIHIQAICDNDLILRNVAIGYPASVHDARVFSNSNFGQFITNFLSHEEWIAADSAYKLTENVITPFRENSNVGTMAQRKRFNKYFSGYRVKIEQTFGILKNVFGSLRCLRVRVDKKNGHKRACDWILACCVLYNIVKPVLEVEIEVEDNQWNETISEGTTLGEARRLALFEWVNSLEN